ncbi:MAG: DUF952 domain-containing protein [Pseudomonadota bacterium]
MLIYKVLTPPQYEDLQLHGEIPGAPVDIADGFVHFSTAEQLAETLAKHFAGQPDLWLLALDSEAEDVAAALEWEPSRGGALFPHLYAALRLSDVVSEQQIAAGPDGVHRLPDGLA